MNRYDRDGNFVPPGRTGRPRNGATASTRPLGWLAALWGFLARPKPAQPAAGVVGKPVVIYVETPRHIRHVRDRASEARWLLRRYTDGKPTSRRKCMQAGMSDGAWRRARRCLIRAGVISGYDGRLLYSARDAKLRLDVYLDSIERRARASDRFVAP